MLMKHWLTGLAIAALLTSTATAQNIGFLNKGPLAYLNDTEKTLLTEALKQALDNSADGENVKWENPATGHKGRIEVIDTHQDYGTTCRTLLIHTYASGREGGGVYRLCQADDDSWRFAPRRSNKQP